MFAPFNAWFGPSTVVAKFARSMLVAAASAATYAILVLGMIHSGRVNSEAASFIAYLCALPLNFVGNRRLSFRSTGLIRGEAARFVLLHLFGAGLSSVVMAVVTDWLGLHHGFGVAAVLLVVPLTNFVAMNLWVFQGQPGPR